MASKGLLDSEIPKNKGDDDTGTNRIGVISNRHWKEDGCITFWLHTNPEGKDAILPAHRAVGRFPTMVEYDNQTWLSKGEVYVLPDDPVSSLGQKRWRRKEDRDAGNLVFPFWYTKFDRENRTWSDIPKYDTLSPHWLVYHAVADALMSGDLDLETPVFHWNFVDQDGSDESMTWRAGEILGRMVYGSDADFRKCVAPSYESVIVMVDNENVSRGPQLLITTSMLAGAQPKKAREPGFDMRLGKLWLAVQAEQRQIEANNKIRLKKGQPIRELSDADPYLTPYPITLTHIPNASSPTDTYSVNTLRSEAGPGGLYEPDEEVLEAIRTQVSPKDIEFAFQPRRGDFEKLYNAMRAAADAANCGFLLSRLDSLFQPWADSIEGRSSSRSGTSSTDAFQYCGCGLEIDPSWDECPNCGSDIGGTTQAPDIEEISDTGRQKCEGCGHVYSLSEGRCPECDYLGIHLEQIEALDTGY